VILVLLVIQVLLDLKAKLVQLEFKDILGTLVTQEEQVILVIQVILDQQVILGTLVKPVQLDLKGLQVILDILVKPVQLVFKGLQVILDILVHKDLLE
jgi:hypothetical protein